MHGNRHDFLVKHARCHARVLSDNKLSGTISLGSPGSASSLVELCVPFSHVEQTQRFGLESVYSVGT